ncbi:MAG: hypothetical protein HeimC3_11380 [Candidatus Heimdallarchaeota archaeon LC_3]|nr:MAG: hypothetical protein HeimC3_11380 [Candidatus Heimdallarchaeota archaeon LC_3]
MTQKADRSNCFKCKGDKNLCVPHRCPMRTKLYGLQPVQRALSNEKNIDGFVPPSFFVGSSNWPNLTINPMMSVLDQVPDLLDEPDNWKIQYSIPDIVKFRSHLIRASAGRIDVKNIHDNKYRTQRKILETSQELLMSQNPTHTYIELEKPLRVDLGFSTYTSPMGPVGRVKQISLEDTPKINYKIDRVVSDTDNTATNAVNELWSDNLTVTQINRIFSAGMLGTKKNRRVVPTRWSITATDDILTKKMIEKIKDFNVIDHYEVWRSDYLDNHFRILIRPYEWSFEFLEAWKRPQDGSFISTNKSPWMFGHDWEYHEGRKTYAKSSQGGYYATRLAVVEHLLKKLRKQAEVIVFREVGEDYFIPLGVWQVRENVRNAFSSNSLMYEGNEEKLALDYLFQDLRISKKLLTTKSILLKRKNRQLRLSRFL